MDKSKLPSYNSKIVKTLCWVLIVGSVLFLLKPLFMLDAYLGVFNKYQITRNFNPPFEYNFTYFLVSVTLEMILSIAVFVSAVFVLKFDEAWRKILIYSLAALIIELFVSPHLILNALWFSVIISLFFISVIIVLSKKEIKVLFGAV